MNEARKSPARPRHVYLVDGSGFIFRAFHALPPMTRADGTPVNAVFGFTNMLMQNIISAELRLGYHRERLERCLGNVG